MSFLLEKYCVVVNFVQQDTFIDSMDIAEPG